MQNHREPIAPLAVTIGDPSGVGIDCLLLALAAQAKGQIEPLPAVNLFGDPEFVLRRANVLGVGAEIGLIDDNGKRVLENRPQQLAITRINSGISGQAGNPSSEDAPAVLESITSGVASLKNNQTRALVTLPINKKSLYDCGFDYPGHTEFLGALAKEWPGIDLPVLPVMMLAGPQLRAVPVTIHIPLSQVPETLSEQLIIDTALITARDLKNRFGLRSPRLAISGLNPHAGEQGSLGVEDDTIIRPAVRAIQSAGIDCVGPLPADTMFHEAARLRYDVAICMYHDQALIPAKALAFDETVNVTLGLPFVRTSPDHGTAHDIAGTLKANPNSTIAALRLADALSRNSTA